MGVARAYVGEGPIGFRATQTSQRQYAVENQWGGSSAPWNAGGIWTIGGRDTQRVVALKINSSDGGKTFAGTNITTTTARSASKAAAAKGPRAA